MVKANKTVTEFIDSLSDDRKNIILHLVKLIRKNISSGFEEGLSNGMISYYVPHSRYPDGYHCKPSDPLPFFWIACAKSNIAFYHMGIYADQQLFDWFVAEYPKHSKQKLDMGKSCVRFKKMDDIPYKLIGQLMKKMTAKQWIELYEDKYLPKNKKK